MLEITAAKTGGSPTCFVRWPAGILQSRQKNIRKKDWPHPAHPSCKRDRDNNRLERPNGEIRDRERIFWDLKVRHRHDIGSVGAATTPKSTLDLRQIPAETYGIDRGRQQVAYHDPECLPARAPQLTPVPHSHLFSSFGKQTGAIPASLPDPLPGESTSPGLYRTQIRKFYNVLWPIWYYGPAWPLSC